MTGNTLIRNARIIDGTGAPWFRADLRIHSELIDEIGPGLEPDGLIADFTLFESDIEDRATFDDPVQLATGIDHVFVAGEAVVAGGRPTGRLPGRLIP